MMRVLLADNHALVRAAIRSLLQRIGGIEIVAEAGDGAQAVAFAARYRPQVVLMDITMSVMDGLAAANEIRRQFPDMHVLILSPHADTPSVVQALRAGASGFLLKDSETADLEHALNAVARGAIYIGPCASKQLFENCFNHRPEWRAQAAQPYPAISTPLTERQCEILRCVAEGLTGKEIAYRLGISPKTVEGHRAKLMQRLRIRDIPGLVRYAIRVGLVAVD